MFSLTFAAHLKLLNLNVLGSDKEMVLFKKEGHCNIGYYAGWDGIKDLQSCLDRCLAESECSYVSFYANESCSRYRNEKCGIMPFTSSSFYTTYKKVINGMVLIFLWVCKFEFTN